MWHVQRLQGSQRPTAAAQVPHRPQGRCRGQPGGARAGRGSRPKTAATWALATLCGLQGSHWPHGCGVVAGPRLLTFKARPKGESKPARILPVRWLHRSNLQVGAWMAMNARVQRRQHERAVCDDADVRMGASWPCRRGPRALLARSAIGEGAGPDGKRRSSGCGVTEGKRGGPAACGPAVNDLERRRSAPCSLQWPDS